VAHLGSIVVLWFMSFDVVGQNNCTSATYPVVSASSAVDEDITNVTVGAMNNSSICGFLAPGAGSIAFRYSNYTGAVAGPTASQGSLVPFSLTMTTCGGAYLNFFQIYIDWNLDSDFLDAGERVYSQPASVTGNQTIAGSFTVPVAATIGTTRMRVVNVENPVLTTNYAQTGYTWGETEDYCFTVSAAAACAGTPNVGSASISPGSGCASANFTLSASGLSTGTGITYQWQSSSSAAGPWTNILGATSSTLNTSAASNTYYQLVTTCVNSGLSSATNAVLYSVNSCIGSITMIDSYGDGWNGATMTLNVNGNPYAVYGPSFTTGTSQIIGFCLPQGATYSLVFSNGGGFSSEVGVSLSIAGSVVYNAAPGIPTVGSTLVSGPTCTPPVPCTTSCNGGPPPANDACSGAQNLGAVPTPAACPNGIGTSVNFNTTNVCATAEPNYTSLLGCQPAGNQATPAADVWYRFTIVAPVLNVTINGLGTPNIALYEGTNCANLLPRGCSIGSSGFLSSQFQGLAPGTYYLQVSGGDIFDQCNFNLTLQNNYDCQGCVLGATLDATPPPVNGQYQPGTLVTFCYQVSSYSQISANWLHGVIPTFGPGWDLSTFVALPTSTVTQGVVAPSCTPNGTWSWYTTPITSSFSGVSYGPGFFFETAAGSGGAGIDGNPGNNYGDNNPGAVAPNTNPTDDCIWTFCWQIRTKQLSQCVQDQGLNVTINTTGDSESGSYGSVACVLDPVTNFFSQSNCCPTPTVIVTNPTCAVPTGSAIGQGLGTSPWTYVWKNSAGVTLLTNSNTAGTSTITGLAAGDYTLTVTDATGCASFIAFSIVAPAPPSVTANSVNFNSVCAGPIASESATPTITLALTPSTAIANWSLFSGTTATGVPIQTGTGNPNYAFTNSTCSNQSYVYQIIPTLNGCNGTPLIINVTVLPKPLSTFTITPNPICVGQTATLTYTSPTCPSTTFNWQAEVGSPLTWTSIASAGLNAVGSGSGPITISPTTPGTYRLRVQAQVVAGCQGPMSPILTLTVNPTPTATIAGPPSVCSGNATALNLTSTPAGATFNWTQTATNASGSSNGTGTSINQTLTNTGAVNGTVQYVVTPVLNGCTGATSNTTVSVLQLPTATLLSSNNVCPGTSNAIIIQGTPGAQVTVVNGANNNTITIPPGGQISLSPNFYSWTTWPNGMNLVFTQVATTSAPICTTPLNFAVTANPTASASISIALTAGNNPSCAGSSLTFTATAINGGTAPQYQWAVNGVPAGTNSPTFTTSSLTNGQIVTCTLTSNATCLTSNVALSNQIVVTITPITLPAFNPIAQLCYGAAPIPALPSSSLNGITGIWSPTVISNTASGNYIFTPNPNQCASPTNLNVTVAPQVVLDGIYHD
jgi:hypothetical protein